jgi:hypothetical protein
MFNSHGGNKKGELKIFLPLVYDPYKIEQYCDFSSYLTLLLNCALPSAEIIISQDINVADHGIQHV